jgi:hypothetical protein
VEPPSWLNEGVASLMEWDHGLREEHRPRSAQAAPLRDFMAFSYHRHGGSGQAVALWYRQAASLAAFLMRRFTQAQFVAFCDALRKGASPEEALPVAYGPQISGLDVLERLWREGLPE